MTVFYCFPEPLSISGDFTKDGIGYSVIGARYTQEPEDYVAELDENGEPIPFEPIFIDFLVNTTKPVEGWEANRCEPSSPMRMFG